MGTAARPRYRSGYPRQVGRLLQVEHGSLYPALHRLRREGWIESEWGTTQNNQRAKFYRLTQQGKQHLSREETKWKLFVKTMARVRRPQE